MAVLTNIPNNTSARDWRDTVNALIKRIAALEAAGVPVETPAPAFTTQPSISPTSGTAGSTVYAATPGTISNGSVVSRAWLLNGTAISTGVTAVPASAGTLTYQETASGPGGTTTSTVQVAAVTAATVTPTPAPSFTSQPSISPNTGTAGTTTFTATAGNVSNGSITARSWTINGTVISTGITAAPASSGTLTYQETATGPGGTTQSTVQQVTVATAAAAAPAFTSQPTVSPSTGTAGATTYTATPGAVSNGSITSRAWALNGSTISTGLTAAPASAGTLTYQEFATGTGGSASSSVLTRTVSAATPALAISPTVPSISSNAAAGTLVSNISNVPAGVTPSVTPNDGRLVIAGSASAGWKVVVGMSALSAGQINFSVAATGATSVSGVLTVTAASTGTPDGVEEATISPANTTLRSTYDFTKTGTAYSLTKNAYNGNGVYWPNKPRPLLIPNPAYPDLKMSYYSPDHGGSDSGIFVALVNGDPTVPSNWRTYDDAKANTDWLSHLSNLPAANPIYIGPQAAGSGYQMETPCIIPYNGKWIVHFQMTNIPQAANQGTVRAVTSDGFNFTSQFVSLLVPTGYTDGHTGYFTGGLNPFPGIIDPGTGVKALYAAWSLHGGQRRSTLALWATDNPETGTWRLVQTFGKLMGRNALGNVGDWLSFAFINMDWGSIRQTRQGWSFLCEAAEQGSGQTARAGNMYEVLMADDGRTMLGKPQLVIARGAAGTIDNGEVSRGETFVFGNKRGFIYEAADSANTKVAALATSPLRSPSNTWFEPLTPAIPTFATKQVNFQTATAIPSGFTAVTTGAPAASYSASGAALTLAPNDAYFLFENDGFDPTTTDYVDIFLDDFRTISGPSTANRIPYIGFATSKTARSAMTDAFFLSNGEGTAGTMSYTALVGGAITTRASGYVWGIGYSAVTGQTIGPKHKGIRWFPKSNEAFVLEEGAEGEPIKTNTINYPALLDKTKRYYPFIGFVSTGTTAVTEQIGKMIVRVADSGTGSAPAPSPAPTPSGNPATYGTRAIASSPNNQASYSHTGIDIGVANATRRIVVFVGGRAAATSPTIAVTITPAGGSAIAMTQPGISRSTFDSPAETTMLMFVATVPTGTTADVAVTVTGGPWVREGLTLFPIYNTASVTPAQISVASGKNDAAMSTTINKLAKGIVLGAAIASTSSSTIVTSAAESGADNPTAVSAATVSLSNISNDPATWTGLANSAPITIIESTGSAGGAMIVATWAAA